MRHEDLPSQTRDRLREILLAHRGKAKVVPRVGNCFFLEAPSFRPQEEPDHALVAAISEEKGALVCAKVSLEYWEASEHDYMLDPEEWSAGYPAIVEVWNSILFIPKGPMLIHASISPPTLELLKKLFLSHQSSQSPPMDLRGVGRPMPYDPRHPAWKFRAREAEVMERVRRHYHERWEVNVITLPRFRPLIPDELPLAASTEDLATRIKREMEAQRQDKEILSTSQGALFMRRDETGSRYCLLWYSEQGSPPPQLEADPPLQSMEGSPTGAPQTILGFWPDELLRREILIKVRAEGLSRDLLVRLPPRRR